MNDQTRKSLTRARLGRRLVQTGFLLLFLFPWLPGVMTRFTGKEPAAFTSWILPFDLLLNTAKVLHGDFPWIVAGAVLFILASSWVLGRAFCGWVCPLGTVFDWVRSIMFWQKKPATRPSQINSHARFRLLAFVMTASFLSLQLAGWFDPLVIFNRAASALITNLVMFDLTNIRLMPVFVSGIFIIILVLELVRPRFWCRNVCPFGALVSLPAHFSLMNRRVSNACTYCGECRNICPMRAIEADPHNTRYSDCTFCLECEAACPNQGISFGFGRLALSKWQKKKAPEIDRKIPSGSFVRPSGTENTIITRRQMLEMMVAGGAGLAAVPLLGLIRSQENLVRPPGALPEDRFLQTCIACQECVRICPSMALRPAFLEGGLTSIGTPYLASRQGACSFISGCPQLCAQVCPVGAIRPIPVSEMKSGVARVDHKACLAWDQGEKCLVCVEACLSDAAKSINGRVIVDAEKCIGCGRCESGCPVPGSAIRVYPI